MGAAPSATSGPKQRDVGRKRLVVRPVLPYFYGELRPQRLRQFFGLPPQKLMLPLSFKGEVAQAERAVTAVPAVRTSIRLFKVILGPSYVLTSSTSSSLCLCLGFRLCFDISTCLP